MARTKKAAVVTSPQAKLTAVIKTARDAMRKDAGLNGDVAVSRSWRGCSFSGPSMG
jgi:hypothetical protein